MSKDGHMFSTTGTDATSGTVFFQHQHLVSNDTFFKNVLSATAFDASGGGKVR